MVADRLKRQMEHALPKIISYFKNDKMFEMERSLTFTEHEIVAHYGEQSVHRGRERIVLAALQKEYLFFEGEKMTRVEADWAVFTSDGLEVVYRPSR